MRFFFIFCIVGVVTTSAFTQVPPNDECVDAINLSLTSTPACPDESIVNNNFSYTNINASPISPIENYPTFFCADGTDTNISAEVWFSFTATGNVTTISLTGLNLNAIVLFTGTDCSALTAIACTEMAGTGTLTAFTVVGASYYLLVSGGDIDDQADFDLTISSNRLCGNCDPENALSMTFSPASPNGLYDPGEVIQVCVTVNEWDHDASGTDEWLHSMTFEFGPGWLPVNPANTYPPPAAFAVGTWGWTSSWVGCNSGQTFTNGFGFESGSGLGCGAMGVDSDPGNNWGDGPGTITPANSLTFCLDLEVGTCPPSSDNLDLSVTATVWSDGASGSYTLANCNSGNGIGIIASANCCIDDMPLVNITDNTCSQTPNGELEISGDGGNSPGQLFQFLVYDENNNLVFQCDDCSSPVTVTDLDGGDYIINAINSTNGCANSEIASINEDFATASAMINNAPCEGDIAILEGSVSPNTGAIQYNWTGPGGPYSGQTINVTAAGTYAFIPTVNGCELAPETVNVSFLSEPNIEINIDGVLCEGETITLTASGAGGGGSYVWADDPGAPNPRTFTNISAGSYSYMVTGTTSSDCSGDGSISFDINALPSVSLDVSPDLICDGDDITIELMGADIATITWDNGVGAMNENPISITMNGPVTISGTASSSDGCSSTFSTDITPTPPPAPTIISCGATTSSSVEFLWTPVPGATSYEIIINGGAPIIVIGTSYTVTDLIPAQNVTIVIQPLGANICLPTSTTFSCDSDNCPDLNLQITPFGPLCLSDASVASNLSFTADNLSGNTSWSGPGIIDANNGIFAPQVAGFGDHTIDLTYTVATCEYTASTIIVIRQQPTADFIISDNPICVTETTTINYDGNASASAAFNWDFDGGNANPGTGSGPHTVDWDSPGDYTITLEVTEDGCTSDIISETIAVGAELKEPIITCQDITTTSLSFSWTDVPGATAYDISVSSGQTGTIDGNSIDFENLDPLEIVDIELTISSDSPCGSITVAASCSTLDCPTFVIETEPIDDICLTGNSPSVTLDATATGGYNNGTYLWDGPGVTGNEFDPEEAGAGTHTITLTYTEGPCEGSEELVVNIYDTPSSEFSIFPAEQCTNENVLITFEGSAGSGTNYNWDFDGGSATPGTGAGPHLVSWPNAGFYTISLSVSQNGCSSDLTTGEINIQEPLLPPVINCEPTSGSIIFSWEEIEGAFAYEIDLITAPAGATTMYDPNALTYTVGNLDPNVEVEIFVTALNDGPCGESSISQSCFAEDCEDIDINITTVEPICLDENAGPIALEAQFFGGDGNGDTLWEGEGIVDAENGFFNPVLSGPGNWNILLTYTEGVCVYTQTTVISVLEQPTSSFILEEAICINENTIINYSGNSGINATYDWDFGNGIAVPGNGQGPHTVSWSSTGDHSISLVVTENNCASVLTIETIQIDESLALPIISCEATTSSLVFSWEEVSNATGYAINVISIPANANGIFDESAQTYTVNDLEPGQPVEIEIIAEGDGACGNSSQIQTCSADNCPALTVNFTPINDICLNGTNLPLTLTVTASGGAGNGSISWDGPGVNGNQFDPVVAGIGTHILTATYTEDNCTGTAEITVNVFDTPTAEFSVSDGNICTNDQIDVIYQGTGSAGATYTWNFNGGTADSGIGAGPHTVFWPTGGSKTVTLTVTENGCISEAYSQSIEVGVPIAAPVINCSPSTSDIVFSWNPVAGASAYMVNLVNAPAGATTVFDDLALTYTISGLNAGESVEIQVIAVDDGPCPNSSANQICVAENCPAVTIDIDAVAPICLDGSASAIDLNAVIAGGVGGGSELWSGMGITDSLLGIFDPNIAGAGIWVINLSYTEGNCSYNASTEIVMSIQPTADFSIDQNICLSAQATLIYTGSADPTATYDWDFGTATAIPGTGPGPHTLSWQNSGLQLVTLTVTENNCASTEFTQMIQVDGPLDQPDISCTSTLSTITFSWPAVVDATAYLVNIIDIPAAATGVFDDIALTYSVTGLNAGESVEIEVTALGDGACGNSIQNFSCVAQTCPAVTLDVEAVEPICLDTSAMVVNLSATAMGGVGNGSLSWSGTGITDTLGVFNPNVSGPGVWTQMLTYTEGICQYTASIDITVHDQPLADFAIDTDLICVEELIAITYTGTATSTATYDWNFNDGTAIPGTGQGPHAVSWPMATSPSISLTVVENNCTSEPVTQMIMVVDSLIAPMINCDSDNTSLTFSWVNVAGATGYTIDVLDAPAGAAGDFDPVELTYSLANLAPGDEVTIQVNALTDSPCGGVSSQMTCTAQNCSSLAFEEISFGPYCDDQNSQNLAVNIGDNTGTFTWSGPGVGTEDNTFNPGNSGTGMIPLNVVYELNGCTYDSTFVVEVFAVPVASFNIESPICVEDLSTITFDGVASENAIYNWNFDGGIIASGADQGPYTVGWDTSGTYDLSLGIEDNGCFSSAFTLPLTVEDVIAPVEIICQTTTSSSVVFSWEDVAGADTYDVVVLDGPVGIQNGNSYTMTNLTPDQEVTIQVTASGTTACGPSIANGTCLAQACQALTLSIDGSPILCAGENASINFDFTTSQPGPFEVLYTINGNQQSVFFSGDDHLDLGALTESIAFEVISITDVNITECVYPGGQTWTIQVDQPVEAGQFTGNIEVCEGMDQIIDLNSLLIGADVNGVWTEISDPVSTGAAFNADAATFNTTGQNSQNFSFEYLISGGACPDDSALATVDLIAAPIADAGLDQALSCTMGTATLGGNGTTPGLNYLWTSNNPDAIIADSTASFTEISSPGDFTFFVTNASGCESSDFVQVTADFDVPIGAVSISDISCFEANDGAIIIDEVTGGSGPYNFSLNGSDLTSNTFFGNLSPGEHSLIIQGGNNCFTELFISMEQPEEVTVELVANIQNGSNIINLGESVVLEALFSPNINIDTIIWKPDSLNTDALTSINVSPQQTSTYTVTIIDDNGCSDSDDVTVFVQKDREVYVPSAFSPNGDGINDILFIGASPVVQEIKSFLIFNRWGESVFEIYGFQPNEPIYGWDGAQNSEALNAAVFVYFIEVEYIDGEVLIFSGDVILMK